MTSPILGGIPERRGSDEAGRVARGANLRSMFVKWQPAALSAVAMLVITAGHASADDGNTLATEICKAAAAVTSFQATMTGVAGAAVSMTVVRPDRAKSITSLGPITTETVAIGTTGYVRINGGPWQTVTTSGTAEAAKHLVDSITSGATYTPLPDRKENGASVGVFSETLAAAPPLVAGTSVEKAGKPGTTTMTCSYDKATFLMQTCDIQLPNFPTPLRMTYTKWNDPGNVVEIPATVPAAPSVSTAPASISSTK